MPEMGIELSEGKGSKCQGNTGKCPQLPNVNMCL
jgi:hypothetical protein